MRLETELAQASVPTRERVPLAVAPPPHRRRRIDGFELVVLATFSLLSAWVLALDLFQVIAHGRVWTGTDGFYLVDQMQYLAWIRDASHHLLASNLFVLRPTPADYFQPAVAISGGLTALGVAPWLSLLLWKPVAVGAAFYAIRAHVRRSLLGTWPRRAALVLALFFGSFSVIYGSPGVVGDLFLAFQSWGYTFGLIAVAAMLFALLAYDRGRTRATLRWAPALLGAVASALHPWQGELLILVVVGAELAVWRGGDGPRRGAALPVATVIGTAIPLVYYALLGQFDLSWQLARGASKHSYSIWTLLLAIAPLAIPAAFAYRGRPGSFLSAATRIWPLGALAIFLVSASDVSATPLHAFEGITIPLAVLAVKGTDRLGFARLRRRRLLGTLAVAVATIPAIAYELQSAKGLVAPWPGNANFIASDERKALDFLAHDPQPGGVLTRFYLGTLVPAETGRRTFVGDCLWSEPDCTPRAKIAQMVFDGSVPADVSRMFVLQTGARFVLADCKSQPALASELGPISTSIRRFGCATIYTVRSPGRPDGPLAESTADAALRA